MTSSNDTPPSAPATESALKDIVERLRESPLPSLNRIGRDRREAADEIERLRRPPVASPAGRGEKNNSVASPSQCESRSPWQPIESAPVTFVEGKSYTTVAVMVYGPQTGVCMGTLHRFPDRKPTVSVSHLGGDAVEHWGVTHWMPLPLPPGEAK
jgi:hypothetical protein